MMKFLLYCNISYVLYFFMSKVEPYDSTSTILYCNLLNFLSNSKTKVNLQIKTRLKKEEDKNKQSTSMQKNKKIVALKLY